ncbi:hypothetical protein ACFVH7_27135 [Kitasatospora indigofera]|uniref:hypothetical protein n=1 Tax=Kitasatospora indigofera TaxID=67307 RepID=UPI00362C60A9
MSTAAATAPPPDPYEQPALHVNARRRLFELHPGPATQAAFADALMLYAASVLRSVRRHAHQVEIVLRDHGRFGPSPVFTELRSQSTVLATQLQHPYLWPDDGRALSDALQTVYFAVELVGRDGVSTDSWTARFAAAAAAPAPAGRRWDISAPADGPKLYVVTLPPPRPAA